MTFFPPPFFAEPTAGGSIWRGERFQAVEVFLHSGPKVLCNEQADSENCGGFRDGSPLLMSPGSRNRVPLLTVVSDGSSRFETTGAHQRIESGAQSSVRGLDWSILMARAQAGDSEAYRHLLGDMTPYLRSLTAERFRDSRDIEDAVQDVLLTVHAIRHAYDPSRPFGPWPAAIAHRRIVDRLSPPGTLQVRRNRPRSRV